MSKDLHLSTQCYQNGVTVNEIENASIRVFELLYITDIEAGPPVAKNYALCLQVHLWRQM